MTKSIKINASITRATTGKAAAKVRKFQALKERALSIRGNKKKFTELVNLYGCTERMAVKLLTVCKL